MSMHFTKLFSSITESTVWCEPASTRLVWITMLAMSDRHGRVWASLPGLANRARVELADCEQAIDTLLATDRYSRTPDNEGRRIEPIDGGWRLLNHAKYRAIRDEESTREAKREHMRRKRAKVDRNVENVEHSGTPWTGVGTGGRNAEADTEEDQEQKLSHAAHAHPTGAEAPAGEPVILAFGFTQFWSAYPRKEGKAGALKVWKSRRIGTDKALIALLMADVQTRPKSHRPWLDGFVPHAATYLRGERWTDAIDTGPAKRGSGPSAPENVQQRTARLSGLTNFLNDRGIEHAHGTGSGHGLACDGGDMGAPLDNKLWQPPD